MSLGRALDELREARGTPGRLRDVAQELHARLSAIAGLEQDDARPAHDADRCQALSPPAPSGMDGAGGESA